MYLRHNNSGTAKAMYVNTDISQKIIIGNIDLQVYNVFFKLCMTRKWNMPVWNFGMIFSSVWLTSNRSKPISLVITVI